MVTFHIISLFPESFESYLGASIVKRAQEKEKVAIHYYNPRDFAVAGREGEDMTYAERRVDDRPYGGGPGMVMEAMPVVRAVEAAIKSSNTQAPRKIPNSKSQTKSKSQIPKKVKIIFFTPAGKQFTNTIADSYKKYTDIILVCGRYEGIDARVKKIFPMVDISVGPFTLTGGELPAMILIDAITRRIPGVLGDELSIEEERIASPLVYTRPAVIEYNGKSYKVPKILLGGHHAKIDAWKTAKKSKKK